MDIASPRLAPDNDDYGIELEEALDIPARDLIDKAVQAGWEPRAIYKALESVARNQALAYEQDPDPAGE